MKIEKGDIFIGFNGIKILVLNVILDDHGKNGKCLYMKEAIDQDGFPTGFFDPYLRGTCSIEKMISFGDQIKGVDPKKIKIKI